jgi:hypothetical protein
MDLDKLSNGLSAMNDALCALEKAVELSAQTGRFRNILTKNDLDKVAALCVVSIKGITQELSDVVKDG